LTPSRPWILIVLLTAACAGTKTAGLAESRGVPPRTAAILGRYCALQVTADSGDERTGNCRASDGSYVTYTQFKNQLALGEATRPVVLEGLATVLVAGLEEVITDNIKLKNELLTRGFHIVNH